VQLLSNVLLLFYTLFPQISTGRCP